MSTIEDHLKIKDKINHNNFKTDSDNEKLRKDLEALKLQHADELN